VKETNKVQTLFLNEEGWLKKRCSYKKRPGRGDEARARPLQSKKSVGGAHKKYER